MTLACSLSATFALVEHHPSKCCLHGGMYTTRLLSRRSLLCKQTNSPHLTVRPPYSSARKAVPDDKITFSRSNGKPAVVTAATWEECVLKSELPVLVEFWTSWCGPCRSVHPLINEIAAEFDGRIKCLKLNADNDFEVTIDYGVESVPTVLFFRDGKKVDSITGTMPKYIYENAVNRMMGS